MVPYFSQPYFTMPLKTAKIMVLRSFLGIFTFFAGTWSITVLPLSISFIIASLNPFFTVLLSYLLFGKVVTRTEIALMVVAYAAVILIATSTPQSEVITSPGMYRFACCVQVLTAIGMSTILITSHELKTLHFSVVQFNYALISSIVVGGVVLA